MSIVEIPLFWSLSHDTRRLLFRHFGSREFQALQRMRMIETNDGYSLKPFDDHHCMFVHIPKCAGVSICKSLFGNLAGGHTNIKKYQLIFSKAEFDRYFKFAFVRNPWDRLVSAFFFLRRGGFNESDRKWAREKLDQFQDFGSFVRKWVNRDNVSSWRHFVPQHKYVCSTDGKLLVNFVGRFENLEEDFSYVSRRINAESALRVANRTASRKASYAEYYSDETRRIVADVYREDIDLFGYRFDNSHDETSLADETA